ncbi:MAG: nucleotide exchange factor GrpE [Alphaproteobacteria bacterium]|nr:nucleotide exchange factor GrpE [Alphaproteobacteria bacterium]
MNDEKDVKEVNVETVSVDDTPTMDSPVNEDAPNPEIEQLRVQLADMNDKYLRMAAELENTRRRSVLDAESRARNRAMGVAEKILPVMDAVQAALKHTPDDAGIQSMARALESAFAQIGITKIDSLDQPLNPQFHNAIQVVESPDHKSNVIVDEMQTGYMFGDTVLRTAMVVVAK